MNLELEPNTLDPTTLVTFLFRAPPEVRTVELLGSWDNFNVPYRMHHDRRRGNDFWSGCFKFENIIYDGDDLKWVKPRSGGLRQGGTYWYYYRLNYDLDSFDERQPHSTSCPLLPGQKVNILDVPIELLAPPERCRSAYEDIIGSLADAGCRQTMEPGDKFASVEAPPLSKIHSRCLSDEALDGRLESNSVPLVVLADTVSPLPSSHSQEAEREFANDAAESTEQRAESRASSVYSQDGTDSAPVSPRSTGKQSEPAKQDLEHEDEGDLPDFPYPDRLGPSFLGFGATLFASPRAADVAADRTITEDSVAYPPHLQSEPSQNRKGPQSVQNVPFYGSRPGSKLSEDPEGHRPRLYSLPSLDIGEYLSGNQLGSHISSAAPATYYSKWPSEECDEDSPTANDLDNYDLTSPTFSADTISSAGQNTPFRLSAQNSLRESTRHDSAQLEDDSLVDIADRLRALDANEQSRNRQSVSAGRTSYELIRRFNSRSFVNYSLPTIASESNQSLVKTASNVSIPPRSGQDVPPIPSPLVHSGEGEGRSLAEDIFSELGFLGSSIA
ncbi:Hypothetical predicted protein [Lecanosticta acicola]|uniref:Uncharacterized protein n=1 Tax=Lecanosticta acicola TaxID=111012 RepID=A0AAI8Z0I1_9PEZI|nr:Hypothetical predicted protein [Lecanosticta acicola]